MKHTVSRAATLLWALLALASAVAVAVARPSPSQPTGKQATASMPSDAIAVGPIGITVSDLDRAIQFYTSVLEFEKVSECERAGEPEERLFGLFGVRHRTALLRLGQEAIELTEFLAAAGGEGRAIPQDSRSNDHWFQHIAIVVADIDRAYARLREHRVRHASSGPQTLPLSNPNAGGISAFYFRDPDGHALELIHFPPGKGDSRWQKATDALFLGIDHTAIVVADTDRSIEFYRDVFGMRIAGASENYGTEQEHLNNVFGARLRITSMRAPGGPGVEFLEYLTPSDGRPTPADSRQHDLIAWRTSVIVVDAEAALKRAAVERARRCSAGVVEGAFPGVPAAILHDPDGHAVLLRGQPIDE